jgi:hypothetical protein
MVGSHWLTLDGWCMFDIRSLHTEAGLRHAAYLLLKSPFRTAELIIMENVAVFFPLVPLMMRHFHRRA